MFVGLLLGPVLSYQRRPSMSLPYRLVQHPMLLDLVEILAECLRRLNPRGLPVVPPKQNLLLSRVAEVEDVSGHQWTMSLSLARTETKEQMMLADANPMRVRPCLLPHRWKLRTGKKQLLMLLLR